MAVRSKNIPSKSISSHQELSGSLYLFPFQFRCVTKLSRSSRLVGGKTLYMYIHKHRVAILNLTVVARWCVCVFINAYIMCVGMYICIYCIIRKTYALKDKAKRCIAVLRIEWEKQQTYFRLDCDCHAIQVTWLNHPIGKTAMQTSLKKKTIMATNLAA